MVCLSPPEPERVQACVFRVYRLVAVGGASEIGTAVCREFDGVKRAAGHSAGNVTSPGWTNLSSFD